MLFGPLRSVLSNSEHTFCQVLIANPSILSKRICSHRESAQSVERERRTGCRCTATCEMSFAAQLSIRVSRSLSRSCVRASVFRMLSGQRPTPAMEVPTINTKGDSRRECELGLEHFLVPFLGPDFGPNQLTPRCWGVPFSGRKWRPEIGLQIGPAPVSVTQRLARRVRKDRKRELHLQTLALARRTFCSKAKQVVPFWGASALLILVKRACFGVRQAASILETKVGRRSPVRRQRAHIEGPGSGPKSGPTLRARSGLQMGPKNGLRIGPANEAARLWGVSLFGPKFGPEIGPCFGTQFNKGDRFETSRC